MHAKLLNRARLRVSLAPRGPILIKSGIESPDPTRPAMEFVRTRHALVGETVYLPGTSLKGAFRSHAERLLRGAGLNVCDPLDRQRSCQAVISDNRKQVIPERSSQKFSRQCPACRTFGSLGVAGRCSVEDAYPWPLDAADEASAEAQKANLTERRMQVGIDRRTGSAHGAALFDLEVVVAGEFHTEIHLQNFQLWQLGLIAAVLDDVDAGDAPIGFGKSRGLGQVGVKLQRLDADWSGPRGDKLYGSGALCSDSERKDYGLGQAADDALQLPNGVSAGATWRGHKLSLEGRDVSALLDEIAKTCLAAYVRRAGTS
jgi:CRISPR/Cas system CSM-associated protein Csm3 (group 7 of RAMP superfamily)